MYNFKSIKHNVFLNAMNDFIYSLYFPLSIAAWAVFCFVLNLQAAGLFALIAVACIILVTLEDMTPILPLFTVFVLLIKSYAPLTTLPYIIFYCLLFICLVCRFIRFPVKSLYLGKLFFPLCLVSAALALGGSLSRHAAFRAATYANGLVTILSVGPAVLFVYSVFLNGLFPPENFDIKTYLCGSVIIATVFAAFEILFVSLNNAENPLRYTKTLGWGNFNTFGAMVLIAVPLCGYLIVKTGKTAGLLSVVVFLIAADILCGSDGSSGIVIFSLPLVLILAFLNLKKSYKKEFTLCIFVLVIICCATGIILYSVFGYEEIMSYILLRTESSGRTKLYEKATALFKENPLFGTGVGFTDKNINAETTPVNFHSTFFHVAATMGIFGLIAYTVYFVFRFRIIMSGRAVFNKFLFYSFVAFECYGLIDVCEFNVIPLLTFTTLLIAVAELNNKKTENASLPLSSVYRIT